MTNKLTVKRPRRKSSTHSLGAIGSPKKGGAGGKGTWGVFGDELRAVAGTTDPKDPNYDDEGDQDLCWDVLNPTVHLSAENTILIIEEYFAHLSMKEVRKQLKMLNIAPICRPQFVQLLISSSLDHKNEAKEATSRLIANLYPKNLSSNDICSGFTRLFDSVSDLEKDNTPDANHILAKFIARAIADDCIPPAFLSTHDNVGEKGKEILSEASHLLNAPHGSIRMSKAWGVCGGNLNLKLLEKRINLLLREFISSNDIEEAERCLKDLNVPHFHHEFVFKLLMMAIETVSLDVPFRLIRLLNNSINTGFLAENMADEGFKRVEESLDDLIKDVPNAKIRYEKICKDYKRSTRKAKLKK